MALRNSIRASRGISNAEWLAMQDEFYMYRSSQKSTCGCTPCSMYYSTSMCKRVYYFYGMYTAFVASQHM
jgi:hypothetical protein